MTLKPPTQGGVAVNWKSVRLIIWSVITTWPPVVIFFYTDSSAAHIIAGLWLFLRFSSWLESYPSPTWGTAPAGAFINTGLFALWLYFDYHFWVYITGSAICFMWYGMYLTLSYIHPKPESLGFIFSPSEDQEQLGYEERLRIWELEGEQINMAHGRGPTVDHYLHERRKPEPSPKKNSDR